MEQSERMKIVVAGGGFAGLETAFYLRHHLGERADITLVSDKDYFLFRPYLTYIPFGLIPDEVTIDLLEPARREGVTFLQGRVRAVQPDAKEVVVDETRVPYDFLVLATGATIGPESVPGLMQHAYTLWRQADMVRLLPAFRELVRAVEAGHRRRVVFMMPPGCDWAGPLYEMAFMLSTWLRWHEVRHGVDITLLTPERTLMQAFGSEMHVPLADEFARHRIVVDTEQAFTRVDANAVIDGDGHRVPYDLLIATPTYAASVAWSPLPLDAGGFVKTVPETRQVDGYPEVYAVGDTSDYPVKQAYVALLQADAAAEHIASRVLERVPEFAFEPSGLWLMEQLDQAMLARETAHRKEGAAGSEEIEPALEALPVGELRRLYVSDHVPNRYAGDNPLYSGLLWKGTKVGLKMLSQLAQRNTL